MHKQIKDKSAYSERVTMSGLGGGVENPMSGLDDEEGGGEFDTADKDELVKKLSSM